MTQQVGARILVVEDEAIVALDIQSRLRNLGYSVARAVSSGEAAIEAARELQPDLILMDIMLEGEVDGITAAGHIRERQQIPIIYLTAYADEQTLQRAKATDPFGYIIKPFEDRELAINIEMALYKHRLDRKLRDNERWLHTTLHSIGDGVVATDAEGRITFLNAEAVKMLGTEDSRAVGRELDAVLHFFDEIGGELVLDMAGRAIRSGAQPEVRGDLMLVAQKGERVPVQVSIAPISRGDGGVMGSVLVIRDVSGRRQAEMDLKRTVNQLRLTVKQTVNALAITSEKRDPYTAGHQQRVAQLACTVAAEMGLDEDMIEGIRVAGLLHDIGKIYVPAEILSKPARLTTMEMGIMKTHSEVGYDILKEVPFPWPVADIVLQHHERMDGSGYPNGLSGEEMLVQSRIISVADVVEAMSSHRPYRAALGIERALEEISRNKGKLYDPDMVDICLRLFRNGFQFQSV
ncbi:putative PAS/PAC sensor protein [Alkalidesulfovibrio alkalitolerans DSM 16529]|uniref:Putative PAS/PAC sensor protein n=1 Tax=Alkalidesulfovibrio alkalitolerans DSM 16529 TaxID=1121439 RepID=S7UK82_9BACT|nr:HD domain-containing phosphohydrolase [Alkalidesulfovibrio alkalitolerans]EPR34219.1 putative PAS/PAC sensor protein [Alkalidesulfovibrio alkalitolerans DSM 16529]